MKNFSIFEQALKFSGVEETENLGEIASLSRRDFSNARALSATRRPRPSSMPV